MDPLKPSFGLSGPFSLASVLVLGEADEVAARLAHPDLGGAIRRLPAGKRDPRRIDELLDGVDRGHSELNDPAAAPRRQVDDVGVGAGLGL